MSIQSFQILPHIALGWCRAVRIGLLDSYQDLINLFHTSIDLLMEAATFFQTFLYAYIRGSMRQGKGTFLMSDSTMELLTEFSAESGIPKSTLVDTLVKIGLMALARPTGTK